MDYLTVLLLAGLAGGLLRGVAGYTKHLLRYKDVPFKLGYFILQLSVSGAIGLLAAWVTADLDLTFLGLERLTPALGFVAGYAGGDMIENLFKIILKKPDLPNV